MIARQPAAPSLAPGDWAENELHWPGYLGRDYPEAWGILADLPHDPVNA